MSIASPSTPKPRSPGQAQAAPPPAAGPGAPAPQPHQASGSTAGHPGDPALAAGLADLVHAGVLTEDQADAVRSARDAHAAAYAPATPTGSGPEPTGGGPEPTGGAPEPTGGAPEPGARAHNPLPEILGYAGAALVGSAALNLLLQSWDSWATGTRLAVAATATATLVVAGLVMLGLAGGREGLAARHGRRRLVAVLLALAAPLAGLTTALGFDLAGRLDNDLTPVVAGAVTFAVAVGAAWAVRGVLTTLAVALGSGWLAGSAMALAWPEPVWVAPVAATLVAAAWLAVAPRLLAVPALSEALGWGALLSVLTSFALWTAPPEGPWLDADRAFIAAQEAAAWTARGLLVVAAIAGAVVFLRGGRWPWAAGSVAAAVFATISIAGQALTLILALLVAGIVLLAASAGLVVLRRRSDRLTSDPAQQLPTGPAR